jgi:uncharacterized membrane protein
MNFLKLFIPALFIPIILDFVWLGLIAKPIYVKGLASIGRIEGDKIVPVMWASGIVYLLIALGIVQFVIPKAIGENSLRHTFLTGLLFGIILYGVYDFTNYAVLKDYPIHVALIDLAWGGILCGVTASLTQLIYRTLT